ncbi:hypothetical protein ACFWP2_30005 [Kitasatospora sp. NPDC058444]|uniref:hypothetical protein n=1 Tax=Kitasatospora sp. NPDC058444 TaxID=3346504 RepID=UPI00364A4673
MGKAAARSGRRGGSTKRGKTREHTIIVALIVAVGGIVAAVITTRCQASPPNAVPSAFQGTWQGWTTQRDSGASDRTTITVRTGDIHQEVGESAYDVAAGSCRGVLTLSSAASTTLEMVERIETGPCVPTGSVTLTLKTANEVAYVYTGDKKSGTRQTADGVLRKIG